MKEVIRYMEYTCGVTPSSDGEFMLYTQHKVIVNALQAEITKLKSLLECDIDDCK